MKRGCTRCVETHPTHVYYYYYYYYYYEYYTSDLFGQSLFGIPLVFIIN